MIKAGGLKILGLPSVIGGLDLTKYLILRYNFQDALAKGGNLYGRKIQEILNKKFF